MTPFGEFISFVAFWAVFTYVIGYTVLFIREKQDYVVPRCIIAGIASYFVLTGLL